MQEAPFRPDEAERLKALEGAGVVAAPGSPDFDRVARLAAQFAETPMALLNFVDDERQWHMARMGPFNTAGVDRCDSFCAHTIAADEVLTIPDAKADPRFHDNPLVTGAPRIGAYCGVPVHGRTGHPLGSLCVLDHQARDFDDGLVHVLKDLARIAELTVYHRQLGEIQEGLLRELDAARRERLIDSLTGVWNRRGFDELLAREHTAAAADGDPVALIMLDLDDFKNLNDTYGHPTGDAVLKYFTQILRSALGDGVLIARLGGEEFAVLVRCDAERARGMADDLVAAVERDGIIPDAGQARFTVSAGMAVPRDGAQSEERALLREADAALYRAKENGRNRAETSAHDGGEV